ncbi:radical SAM protein [Thermogladius sp. 4427co]|uniref:radical SAM protein n=1 Tax=Thermogladius sp. 4427co TaxID=3450718 RepID=UPI003F7B2E7D
MPGLKISRAWGSRFLVYVDDLPLFGHIAFGIIDRGTNILQVRPTTLCPYNCVYCSVDAGPYSRRRLSEFIVDPEWLVKWVRIAYKLKKGEVIEALLDGVGEPPTHPGIVYIVRELKNFIPRVAVETRGFTLTKSMVLRLWEAGLDRLNVSIDTLDEEKAKFLAGQEWFSVRRVREIVEFTLKETTIDVMLTPVWIPGVNDNDIQDIIEWGLKIGVGRRFPGFGIQKYEVHKYGRKIKGVREPSWTDFYDLIHRLEEKYGIILDYRKLDIGVRKAPRIPLFFRRRDIVELEVRSPGWLKGEALGVSEDGNAVVTIVGVNDYTPRRIRALIIENGDGIYIAKPLD